MRRSHWWDVTDNNFLLIRQECSFFIWFKGVVSDFLELLLSYLFLYLYACSGGWSRIPRPGVFSPEGTDRIHGELLPMIYKVSYGDMYTRRTPRRRRRSRALFRDVSQYLPSDGWCRKYHHWTGASFGCWKGMSLRLFELRNMSSIRKRIIEESLHTICLKWRQNHLVGYDVSGYAAALDEMIRRLEHLLYTVSICMWFEHNDSHLPQLKQCCLQVSI